MIRIGEFRKAGPAQERDIRTIEAACKVFDSLTGSVSVDTELNFDQTMHAVFLLYEDDRPVSFLVVFAPESSEGEISSMTLPEARRKGYFNRLYERASAELRRCGVPEVLLVCESGSQAGRLTVASKKGSPDHTEYTLRYSGDGAFLENYPYRLELFEAQRQDVDALTELEMRIFREKGEEAHEIIEKALVSEVRRQFGVRLGGRIIGVAASGTEEGATTIFGLGIAPEFQGRGYGRELLYRMLQELLARGCGPILIEVDSTNRVAYELYRSSGFVPIYTTDYYRARL